MGNRYRGLDAFVATRGAALMRTAWLLTGDRAAAEKALKGALIQVAIRWPKVVRGGAPEPDVRRVLYGVVVDDWRRRRLLDVEPSEASGHPHDVDGTNNAPRSLTLIEALARLTRRRRAMLVLCYYDDLAEVVIADILHCSVSTVISQTNLAWRQLRALAPDLAESQLREVMDEAAVSSIPDGMARLAEAGARQQRRQRFAALAAVAAVVTAVTVFTAVAQPFNSASDEPGRGGAAPFPDALPAAGDLAPLAEAPMEAASAAYMIDDEVVLVNALTGEAVRAFASEGDFPPSLSGATSIQSALSGSTGWDRVSLSPDGRTLLLMAPNTLSVEGLRGRLIYLLDVGTGDLQRLSEVVAVKGPAGGLWSGPQVSAWSPDSRRVLCLCFLKSTGFAREAGLVTIAVAGRGPHRLTFGIEGRGSFIGPTPIQVAFGEAGPAYQRVLDGPWLLHPRFGDDVTLGAGTVLGLGAAPAPVLLAGPSEYQIRSVDGFSLGGGSLGGQQVVAVGAASTGFTMTLATPGPAGAPLPSSLDVVLIATDGKQTALTKLPAGSSSPSFAANLVGP